MAFPSGSRLGSYQIVAAIGAGGMGEVYRARDCRLDREVALKVLPEPFACDAERMVRFEREAKLLASLNHPNIAHIYGLEESSGRPALVMELVEGRELRERIKQPALTIEEALPLARQIAEALEYAHERGIIHRDLKPANVKLTPDGQVKLLDFGLAKALEPDAAGEDLQNSPTLSVAATRAGMLLGTAAYMSPEQARGKTADRRTDIWSFGCVLYEMLAGTSPFSGDTTSDTLASVLRAEPDWSMLPSTIPARIRELLQRCLQKDPKLRLQAIGEARIAIDAVIANVPEITTDRSAPTVRPSRWRAILPWAVAFLAILLAAVLAYLRPAAEMRPVMQLSLALPKPMSGILDPNPGSPFAISPDGSQVAFSASDAGKPPQLFLLSLDQRTAVPLAGTENATQPFFSPDGQWIGFFSLGRLRKVSLHGGPAVDLADAPVPHGANWASDGSIIYAPNFGSGLMRVPAGGGAAQSLTTPNEKENEVSHRWPQVLPGGKAVLFTIQLTTQTTYDDARIAVLSLQTGKWHTLLDGGSYARYVPSNHIVFARAGSLIAAPFDLRRFEISGQPVPVIDGLVTTAVTSGGAEYDIAPTGLLAYVSGTARPPENSLVWVDRHGVGKKLTAPLNNYSHPRISPDGRLMAVQIRGSGSSDIWVYDFARNTMTRLTFAGNNADPVWTADSKKVIYRSVKRAPSIQWRAADGSGSEDTILPLGLDAMASVPSSVSPNGTTLLYSRRGPAGVSLTYALSLDGRGTSRPYSQSASQMIDSEFSPDGQWVAYTSNESGREEVYVQPFPGPGGKWMISTGGGNSPRWSRNGHELFYVNGNKMMSVAVETKPTFKAATPELLFQNGSYIGIANYDIAPDGEHLLMVATQEDENATPNQLNIVLNWTEELKRRAPAEK